MVVAARNSSSEVKRTPFPQQSRAAAPSAGNAASKPLQFQTATRPIPKKLDKKEEKKGFFGCCKPKKKQQNGVKKAAPPKGKFGSLFGGGKKSAAQSTNKSRPSASVTKPSAQRNIAPARPLGQPSLRPPPPQAKQQQPSLGGAAQNAKSKAVENDPFEKSERQIKKTSKNQVKKGGTESTQSHEHEMKTGVAASVKEVKKPKTFLRKKGEEEEPSRQQGCRKYQEVKICVADLGNGFVERKMVLKSVYPEDEPPKPYVSSVIYPKQKGSYTHLKKANSTERAYQFQQPSQQQEHQAPQHAPEQPQRQEEEEVADLSASSVTASSAPSQCCHRRPSSHVDRALSTIVKLRATHDDAQFLNEIPNFKVSALQTKYSLQEAQHNLRNLNVLTVKKLLPDMSGFNEEMSAVIHQLDHFIDSTHPPPTSADPSSNSKW